VLRELGPINETSAFPFESRYAAMKENYRAGTVNICKQILENLNMDLLMRNHMCQRTLILEEKEKNKRDNTHVYIFDNGTYRFFKVSDIVGDAVLLHEIDVMHISEYFGVSMWSSVGFVKQRQVEEGEEYLVRKVKKEDITGKVMKVKDYYVTIPTSSLFEN
jgi:hypothetical protein